MPPFPQVALLEMKMQFLSIGLRPSLVNSLKGVSSRLLREHRPVAIAMALFGRVLLRGFMRRGTALGHRRVHQISKGDAASSPASVSAARFR